MDILHHVGPRRPAHPVLIITTRKPIRDHETDHDTFGGRFGTVSETQVMKNGHTQHRQHDVRDSKIYVRVHSDHSDD